MPKGDPVSVCVCVCVCVCVLWCGVGHVCAHMCIRAHVRFVKTV